MQKSLRIQDDKDNETGVSRWNESIQRSFPGLNGRQDGFRDAILGSQKPQHTDMYI